MFFRITSFPHKVMPFFFADDEFAFDGTGNAVPFSISASGEMLYLCDVDCDEPQIFETGFLEKNMSSGLNENGERVFLKHQRQQKLIQSCTQSVIQTLSNSL